MSSSRLPPLRGADSASSSARSVTRETSLMTPGEMKSCSHEMPPRVSLTLRVSLRVESLCSGSCSEGLRGSSGRLIFISAFMHAQIGICSKSVCLSPKRCPLGWVEKTTASGYTSPVSQSESSAPTRQCCVGSGSVSLSIAIAAVLIPVQVMGVSCGGSSAPLPCPLPSQCGRRWIAKREECFRPFGHWTQSWHFPARESRRNCCCDSASRTRCTCHSVDTALTPTSSRASAKSES